MNRARPEPPGIAIRTATIHDVPLFVAVIESARGEHWSPATVERLLAAPGVWGLIAAADPTRPAGVLLARTAADEAEILNLVVLPRDRRLGIGATLLQAAIGEAQRRCASALFLEVGIDNGPARALYAKLGFEEVGRRPDYYARHADIRADALIMRKQLITLTNE